MLLRGFAVAFGGVKTKSPLDSWAVSGLEIRLNDY
jgi:hypothetical protein